MDWPRYGDVNVPETTFQAVATYSCISGYSLVGDSIRTCQANGSWSGQIPQCSRKIVIANARVKVINFADFILAVDCGVLPKVQHGTTVTNDTVFQSVAHYFCDNGYNLVGVQSRSCESNATWSGNEPVCKGMTEDNTFINYN